MSDVRSKPKRTVGPPAKTGRATPAERPPASDREKRDKLIAEVIDDHADGLRRLAKGG